MISFKPAFLAGLFLSLIQLLSAQPCSLLLDVGAETSDQGNRVANLRVSGGRLYFSARSPRRFYELYQTDGSAAGTGVVREVLPPEPDYASLRIGELADYAGKVVFLARSGKDLWSSDGAPDGTQPFFEQNDQRLYRLYPTPGYLSFMSQNGTKPSLWRTDGTTNSTQLLHSFGDKQEDGIRPAERAVLGDLLMLEIGGKELWRSDGTPDGTILLHDFAPDGFSFAQLNAFVVYQGKLYLTVQTSQGVELWVSDGTVDGTIQVKKMLSSASINMPEAAAVANGLLFVSAAISTNVSELWVSDGTPGGTLKIPGASVYSGTASEPAPLVSWQDRLYFTGFQALWVSDGTPAGTYSVQKTSSQDICCLNTDTNQLYFLRTDVTGVTTLWKSDGTQAGTLPVTGMGKSKGALPVKWTPFAGNLFFPYDNTGSGTDTRLWHTDGTAAGTGMVIDLSLTSRSSRPTNFSTAGDRCFFASSAGHWVSQGSTATSINLDGSYDFGAIMALAPDRACFVDGLERLRLTDGVTYGGQQLKLPSGTYIVVDEPFFTDEAKTLPLAFVSTYYDTSASNDLVRLPDQGAQLEVLHSFPMYAHPPVLFGDLDGAVYFGVPKNDNLSEWALWRSDGTVAGTVPVLDPTPWKEEFYRVWHARVNGKLVFLAGDGHLWTSDGTAAGTYSLSQSLNVFNDQLALPGYTLPVFQSTVVVPGATGTNPGLLQLWQTDATASPQPILPGIDGVQAPIAADQQLFFLARDAEHGLELWRTDGTPDGTWLVKDLWPGPHDSFIRPLSSYGNSLLFTGQDAAHGTELWISDGTPAGTQLVQDIYPGPSGSNAGLASSLEPETGIAGSKMYFSALHPNYGIEPWVLELNGLVKTHAPVVSQSGLAVKTAPNPVSGSGKIELEVSQSGPVYLRIITCDGRELRQWKVWAVSGKQESPLQIDMPPGMYFLQAMQETGDRVTTRFVKE